MKKFAFVFAALCTSGPLLMAGPEPIRSSDKEMKQVAPAPPACDFTWTGFYVGAHGGYGWNAGDGTHFQAKPSTTSFAELDTQNLDPENDGAFAGGQIGYNYQWRKFVIGFETDISWADFSGSNDRSPIPGTGGSVPGILTAHEDIEWFGTARGRLGFTPICRLLLYGTGGLAYGHTTYSANTNFLNGVRYPAGTDDTNIGWTVGGGAEYAVTNHWTVKAEYLYYDLRALLHVSVRPALSPWIMTHRPWATPFRSA